MKILRVKKSRKFGSRFEALGVLGSKSCREQTPIFWEKLGVCFHAYYFYDFGPLKSKYLEKNYMVITLSGFLTILAFKISKKLNFSLKIGILKMLSKNSVSSTHTDTLEIWWHLIHKKSNLQKWKKGILGLK